MILSPLPNSRPGFPNGSRRSGIRDTHWLSRRMENRPGSCCPPLTLMNWYTGNRFWNPLPEAYRMRKAERLTGLKKSERFCPNEEVRADGWMKIVWTHESLTQLTEIEDYISKDSPKRAALFVDQLLAHAESLPGNPGMGRMVPEIGNPSIRELIFKRYRIVYRLESDCIKILTVFEEHRLLRMQGMEF